MRATAALRGAKAYDGGTTTAWAHVRTRTRANITYCITPATKPGEVLAELAANGLANIRVYQTESELSAAAAAIPAGLHTRVMINTGGNGLTYMAEVLQNAPGLSVPLMFDISARNPGGPINIWGDWRDVYAVQPLFEGLIIIAKNGQRAFDNAPLGYRVAEDPRVRCPVMTVKLGFDGTHVNEPTVIHDQEAIDAFLPPFRPTVNLFQPTNPQALGAMLYPGGLRHAGGAYIRHRLNTGWGLGNAKETYMRAWREYQDGVYGKDWRGLEDEHYIPHEGLFDWHGPAQAKKVVILMGPDAETAELVNRNYLANTDVRDTAVISINLFKPYPGKELVAALKQAGVEVIGVVDRTLPYDDDTGTLHAQLVAKAVSHYWRGGREPRILNFVGGVGGDEITHEHFQTVFNVLDNVEQGADYEPVYYLGVPERSILGTEEAMAWMAAHVNPNVQAYFEARRSIFDAQRRNERFFPNMDQVLEIEEMAIHGFGGDGNVTSGEAMARAAVEGLGQSVVAVPLFGSAKKQQYVNVTAIQSLGGVLIRKPSGRPHHSIVYSMEAFAPDMGLAAWILRTTRDNLVVNTSRPLESVAAQLREVDPSFESRLRLWRIDASGMAAQAGSPFFNMFMLGAGLKVTRRLDHQAMLAQFDRTLKPAMAAQVRQGYEAVRERDG